MGGRLKGLPYLLTEGRRCAPGFSGTTPVAHAVAIGTQAREAFELGLLCSGDMEGVTWCTSM